MFYVAAHLGCPATIYKYLTRSTPSSREKGGCLTCSISLPSEGYFAQQEDLLVEAVSRLVRIDSTLGPPAQPGQPLAPARQPLWRPSSPWPRNGPSGENLSGYVGTVDLNNQPDTAPCTSWAT